MAAVTGVVDAVDEFVRRPDVVRDAVEHVDAVRVGGDVLLRQADPEARIVVELNAVQADVVRIAPGRKQLQLEHDWEQLSRMKPHQTQGKKLRPESYQCERKFVFGDQTLYFSR